MNVLFSDVEHQSCLEQLGSSEKALDNIIVRYADSLTPNLFRLNPKRAEEMSCRTRVVQRESNGLRRLPLIQSQLALPFLWPSRPLH